MADISIFYNNGVNGAILIDTVPYRMSDLFAVWDVANQALELRYAHTDIEDKPLPMTRYGDLTLQGNPPGDFASLKTWISNFILSGRDINQIASITTINSIESLPPLAGGTLDSVGRIISNVPTKPAAGTTVPVAVKNGGGLPADKAFPTGTCTCFEIINTLTIVMLYTYASVTGAIPPGGKQMLYDCANPANVTIQAVASNVTVYGVAYTFT